jgi:hypothetical protein
MAEKKSTIKTEKKIANPVNKKENVKTEIKQDPKMKELKIELLKQTSKKKDIRREIARLLTLQNKNMGANK